MVFLWPGNLKILTLSSGKFHVNRAFNKESYDFSTLTTSNIFASLEKALQVLHNEGKSPLAIY